MPLIPSPRHVDRDLAAWEREARFDPVLAQDRRLDQLTAQAIDIIRMFADQGPCHAGTSWGKDSVVLAHLVLQADVDVPVVWATEETGDHENPDCYTVRDTFLEMHPDLDYLEWTFRWRVPLRPEPGWDDPANHQDVLAEMNADLAPRYLSGVRQDESSTRKVAVAKHGLISANTARPIGHWTAQHIWAYLERHQLPIHPAYAMNFAGSFDRNRLRVHSLGTLGGGAKRYLWEDRYYPDIVRPAAGRQAWQDRMHFEETR